MNNEKVVTILNNKDLSWKEKGLYLTIARAVDEGKNVTLKYLSTTSPEGYSGTRTTVNKLIEKGYVKRVHRGTDGKGVFVHYELT